jgi:hypothetical protein
MLPDPIAPEAEVKVKGKVDHEGDTDMAEESKYDVNPEIWAVDNRFFE